MKPTAPQRALRLDEAMPALRRIEEKTVRTKICATSPDKGRIISKTIAERKRNRKHSLPHRIGKYMIHEMSGRFRHAPSVARRTEGPTFSAEGNNAGHGACIAVNPMTPL